MQKRLQDIDNIIEEEIASKHGKMLNNANDSRSALLAGFQRMTSSSVG